MVKPLVARLLENGILTIDGIMEKFKRRERLTSSEEEYLYQHGTVAQVSEVFRDYPLPDPNEGPHWWDDVEQ